MDFLQGLQPIGSRFALVTPEPHQGSQRGPLNFAIFHYQDSGVTVTDGGTWSPGRFQSSLVSVHNSDIRDAMYGCNGITTLSTIVWFEP